MAVPGHASRDVMLIYSWSLSARSNRTLSAYRLTVIRLSWCVTVGGCIGKKFSCHSCYLLFDFLKSPLSGKGRSCVRRQLQAATLLSPDLEGRDIPHLYMKYISAFVCPRQTRILSRFCLHGQTRCVSRLCLKDTQDKTPTLSLSF